ncbi:MAG: hypothetical protein HY360_03210 [Verrucomicrobia bacterium]|nr:hypothetical protein [Verrucomicrobiota bacterium]
MIDSERIFAFYLLITLGPLVGVWISSGWRDRRLRMPILVKWLYRCPECCRFYESDELLERLRCPVCGRQNDRLKI